jgi:predicted TIM-barrel fold metal-dependent hydrolase
VDIPKIISVDDHVIEPLHVWQEWMPKKFADRAPRVERMTGRMKKLPRRFNFVEDPDGKPADVWVFDGLAMPINEGVASAGGDRSKLSNGPMLYDDIQPAAYDRTARLAAMDSNHTEASLCFPNFPRFCGQTFLECEDRELGLAAVQAYNNWMIEEWCGDEAYGRLLPVTLIPLWDAELAAVEVRRCAEKGNTSIAFSESPPALGLPSVHTDYWDTLWRACVETGTVVNMHIGSSSTFPRTGPDSPMLTMLTLVHEGSQRALVDWLCSGVFERFEALRIALSEGEVGWMPFLLDRIDYTWRGHQGYAGVEDRITRAPSSYFEGHVYGCLVDDPVALESRHRLPFEQLMYEIDFPHGDSTFPRTRESAEKLIADSGLSDIEAVQLLRNNAIGCYRLERFGIEPAHVPTPSVA